MIITEQIEPIDLSCIFEKELLQHLDICKSYYWVSRRKKTVLQRAKPDVDYYLYADGWYIYYAGKV